MQPKHSKQYLRFKETLVKAGVEWIDPISVDEKEEKKGYVVRNPEECVEVCRKELQDQDLDELITPFIEGFSEIIADNDHLLVKMMMPLKATLPGATNRKSLLNILLSIDAIQPLLIQSLIEKLPELATKEDSLMNNDTSFRTCTLLLNQFRWLDFVVNPEELTQQLLMCLQACPSSIQNTIIAILPEVATDQQQDEIVQALQEQIETDASLTVVILDTLASLHLPDKLLSKVTDRVLLLLASSKLQDLPLVVKFLLQSAKPHTMETIVKELRDKLDATFLSSTPVESQTVQNDVESLLIETMVQNLRFRTKLTDTFSKVISEAEKPAEQRVFDYWALLAMLSIPQLAKQTEGLIRKKARRSHFRREMLIKAVKSHETALGRLFPTLLRMASSCVQSTATAVESERTFGNWIYQVLFHEFKAPYQRQQVIGSLLTHSGSPVEEEVNVALEIFVELITSSPVAARSFQPYVSFLHQLLDFIERFTISQVHLVYRILCSMAIIKKSSVSHDEEMKENNEEVGSEVDEANLDQLNTIINKQLAHPELTYRRFGIIGRVTLLYHETMHLEGILTSEDLSPEQNKVIQVALHDLSKAASNQAQAQTFLFNELVNIVTTTYPFPKSVLQVMIEHFAVELEEFYLQEYDYANPQQYIKPMCEATLRSTCTLNLDGDKACLQLPLLDIIACKDSLRREALAFMCPLVRLLTTLEIKANGSLEGVEAVLGCPILLMEESVLENAEALPESTLEVVALTLWHAINWSRELVGSFSILPVDTSIQRKVLERLHHMFYLQNLLETEVMPQHPTFCPPSFYQSGTISDPSAPAKSTKKGRGDSIADSYRKFPVNVANILAFPIMSQSIEAESRVIDLLACEVLKELQRGLRPKKKVPFLRTNQAPRTGKDMDIDELQVPAQMLLETYSPLVFRAMQMHAASACELLRSNGCSKADELHIISYLLTYFQTIALLSKYHATPATERLKTDSLVALVVSDQELVQVKSMEFRATLPILVNTLVARFTDVTRTLTMAVKLVETLEGLIQLDLKHSKVSSLTFQADPSSPISLGENLSSFVHRYLERDWKEGQGKLFRYKTTDLQYFVSTYLRYAPLPLDAVERLASDAIEPLIQNRGVASVAYPTLTTASMTYYYRPLVQTIVDCVSRLDFAIGRNDPRYLIAYVQQATLLFKLFVAITKTYQSSMIVVAVLKAGKALVEVILSKAMPFLQHSFRQYHQEITEFLKDFQVITRRLQTLCAHGKQMQNNAVSAQVPMVKKTLEAFIYRVEILAQSHGIRDAYSTGILKNRRIDGTTIRPEELAQEEDDAEEEEEESEAEDTE